MISLKSFLHSLPLVTCYCLQIDLVVANYQSQSELSDSCPCLVGTIEHDCANQACPSQYASCGVKLLEENKQEGNFDFSGVENIYINNKKLGWTPPPKVWTSSIVSGPSTYYYPSGKSPVPIVGEKRYEFEKYEVKLVNDITGAQLTFDANICIDPPNGFINKKSMLSVFEKFPEKYAIALKIVSVNGHGIQFFHNSYVYGAYGGKDYIDTSSAGLGTLMHEAGHTIEQHRRITYGDSGVLNPAWQRAIQCDNIRTSNYGNNNPWEDMAEFSKMFAFSNDMEQSLYEQSPERWLLWNETLAIAQEAYIPENISFAIRCTNNKTCKKKLKKFVDCKWIKEKKKKCNLKKFGKDDISFAFRCTTKKVCNKKFKKFVDCKWIDKKKKRKQMCQLKISLERR